MWFEWCIFIQLLLCSWRSERPQRLKLLNFIHSVELVLSWKHLWIHLISSCSRLISTQRSSAALFWSEQEAFFPGGDSRSPVWSLAVDSSSLRGNQLYEARRRFHVYYGNLYRKSCSPDWACTRRYRSHGDSFPADRPPQLHLVPS